MDEQLLIRFLTHKCSVEEIERVNQWISSDNANAEWLFEMERIWSLKDELRFSDEKEIETAYVEFLWKTNSTKKISSKIRFMQFLKYAAAAIIIILLIGNLYQINKTPDATLAENLVEVPAGQRVSLTLSDGTKVWLNSLSKFTYPIDFKAQNRNVFLEGEGYFEVAHNPKAPFMVETPSVKVNVLGTKFNLKTYDDVSSVTLTEGKVRVNVDDIGKEVLLHPNEEVVYKKGEDTLAISLVNTKNKVSWVEGILIFNEESMNEVLRTLSRHYDATFEIENPDIETESLTMTITDEPLELALEYIRLATGVTYEIEKNNHTKEKAATYHVKLNN